MKHNPPATRDLSKICPQTLSKSPLYLISHHSTFIKFIRNNKAYPGLLSDIPNPVKLLNPNSVHIEKPGLVLPAKFPYFIKLKPCTNPIVFGQHSYFLLRLLARTFLPLAILLFKTLLPPGEAILFLKP